MNVERSAIFLTIAIVVALIGFWIYGCNFISKINANNYEQLEEASEKIEKYRAKKKHWLKRERRKMQFAMWMV